MPNCYFANRQLPFLTDFSTRDRDLAEKAFSEHETRQRMANESRGQKADKLVEDLRGQLHDLLGAKNFAELRVGIKRERLAFRDLWQPPEGLKRDYVKEKTASKGKIDALLNKLGISPEKVRKIGKESDEKLRQILSADGGKVVPGYNLTNNYDKWAGLSELHQFPLPWGMSPDLPDPNDPHRWFLFRPPFFGFLFSFAPQATSSFVSERELFLDRSAGLVGYQVTMDSVDSGDFAAASGTAEAQIGFGFVPPVAGLVEVLIDAQSSIGTHDLDLVDEFGFSDAWCYQNNYLMMNVLHPNVPEHSLALMSNYSGTSDGDDLSEHRENLTRGRHYFADMISSGPVPAGQSVVVTAGTRTFDIAHANDMELHSRSNFQWFINSVEVRIAP